MSVNLTLRHGESGALIHSSSQSLIGILSIDFEDNFPYQEFFNNKHRPTSLSYLTRNPFFKFWIVVVNSSILAVLRSV
jgi:hypothetical protein